VILQFWLNAGEFLLKALLRSFEIVAGLLIEVQFGRAARQASKPQRHVGGHCRGPVQHRIEGRT